MNAKSNNLRLLSLPGMAALILGLATPAFAAPLRNFVYGLDERYRYSVAIGQDRILGDAAPGPAGDLVFESEGETTVHIATPRTGPDPIDSLPPDPVRLFQGPFPNPVRDRAEFRLTTGTEGSARFRLYNPLAGRISFDLVAPLHEGENSLWIEFPSRISSGIYLLRADLPGETVTRKVVFIRH
jgi:hypothetical protein